MTYLANKYSAELEMKFCGICPDGNRCSKKFRCPVTAGSKREKAFLPKPCPINHDLFCSGECYGCTACVDITDDHRCQIPRESRRFKDAYKCRTEAEHDFSRLGPREIEEMSQYKNRAIRNQMTLAHLTLRLSTVSACLIWEQADKIRCYNFC